MEGEISKNTSVSKVLQKVVCFINENQSYYCNYMTINWEKFDEGKSLFLPFLAHP